MDRLNVVKTTNPKTEVSKYYIEFGGRYYYHGSTEFNGMFTFIGYANTIEDFGYAHPSKADLVEYLKHTGFTKIEEFSKHVPRWKK